MLKRNAKELVVTIEGTVGEVVKKRLHIAARRPKLGDVISTEFVITIEDRVPRVLTADLPSNSGLYLAK